MEDLRNRKPHLRMGFVPPKGPSRLWCGKVQGLCDGTLCSACHMFPHHSVETTSILSTPTLVDHKMIGLIRDEEE